MDMGKVISGSYSGRSRQKWKIKMVRFFFVVHEKLMENIKIKLFLAETRQETHLMGEAERDSVFGDERQKEALF